MIGPRPNTAGGLGLSLPTGVYLTMRGLDVGGPLRHFSAREYAEVQEFSTILSHGRRTPNEAVPFHTENRRPSLAGGCRRVIVTL
jgi:hypothetical protein